MNFIKRLNKGYCVVDEVGHVIEQFKTLEEARKFLVLTNPDQIDEGLIKAVKNNAYHVGMVDIWGELSYEESQSYGGNEKEYYSGT